MRPLMACSSCLNIPIPTVDGFQVDTKFQLADPTDLQLYGDGLVNVPSELLQWPPLPMQLDEKRETKDFLLPDACPYQCRAIKLENGITTMLIHDPDAEIASCSLNVAVGSLMEMDPVSGKVIEGLAHFLEHLLFLGTEKYPDEAAYNEFINENGGDHNAYTYEEYTNYHFSIRLLHRPVDR
eukprot:GHVH01013600.1.p1 GENE.GHVH01013600.1~~GHVH01013600.1.p1  ORF type:complete len:212 (+),score=23.82 GHVH01013600.1:93-638(+)